MAWRPNLRLLAGLTLAGALLTPAGAPAVPADPDARVELEQPSGNSFKAKLYGDEWSHGYETVQGYTVVQTRQSEAWRYAKLTDGGELRPSRTGALEEPPVTVDRHVREEDPLDGVEMGAVDAPSEAPIPANTGTQRSLVILVEFDDQDSATTPAQWRDRYFAASDSVADFWNEASYGQLTLAPAAEDDSAIAGTANDGVIGWLPLSMNHPNSDLSNNNNTDPTDFQRVHQTARAAIEAADPYVNYASFDANANNTLTADELHITIIPAGWERSQGCPGRHVWGHKWGIGNNGVSAPVVDGKTAGLDYTMFGELHCNPSDHLATLGIMVHEIGHDLDLPDLYDTSGANTQGGVGDWSVMANSWLAAPGEAQGSDPALPDAFSKYYLGWTNPADHSGAPQTVTVQQAATSTNSAVRLLDNPLGVDWTKDVSEGTGEYFLLENRQKVGYDNALPACGFVIWHIDETRDRFRPNHVDTRRGVQVEAADNDADYQGDSGDVWAAGAFHGSSAPNSNLYGGAASGVGVDQFSACGSSMTARVGTDGSLTPPGPANDMFANATSLGTGATANRDNDTNLAASKEAGEPNHWAGDNGGRSIWYSWTAPAAGVVTVNTAGSDFDTVLAAYTGSAVNGLAKLSENDDFGGTASQISFTAAAGTTYRLAVDGFGGGSGLVDLHLSQVAGPPDTTPPDTTIDSGPAAPIAGTTTDFSFSSSEPGSAFQCRLDSAPFTSCTSPLSLAGLSVGGHTFEVRARDAAGNTDPTPATRDFTVALAGGGGGAGAGGDPQPPSTSITGRPAAKIKVKKKATAVFSFTATEAATFLCSLDGAAYAPCTSPARFKVRPGNHHFEVYAVDLAGNPDPLTAMYDFKVKKKRR